MGANAERFRTRNPLNYIDRKALARPNMQSVRDAVLSTGISVAPIDDAELRLPMEKGVYRIIVDTVSDDRRVDSYVRTVRVGD